jgi:hypothetical protein
MDSTDISGAQPAADNDVARLRSRARIANFFIFGVVAISAIVLAFEAMELAGIVDLYSMTPGPLETAYGTAMIAYTVVFLASVVVVAMWIYRAHANLRDRGIELNTSPGWAVGWYFIPFANLFKPFQAMRELWTESHLEADSYGESAPGEITAWWACWLTGNILANVSMRMASFGDGSNLTVATAVSAIASGLTIASALLLRQLISQITAAQDINVSLTQVFE